MQKSALREFIRRGALVALTTATMITVGCGGGGSKSAATSSVAPAAGANTPPTISGNPVAQVAVGSAYNLTPAAQDADGDTLAFAIANRPAWANFNTATGQLTGTPAAQHAGMSANVVISVSDGKTSVALPAFSITVALAGTPVGGNAVALSWDVPTQAMDGATLSNLTGYRIHYGTKADALTQAIEVPSAGSNNFVVRDLPQGTYYFAVRAVTATGTQSELSNLITQQIS